MSDLKLQYQAIQYWFDASNREDYFIAKAVAHTAALAARGRGEALSANDIRAHLHTGRIVSIGPEWDSCIRSLAVIETQPLSAPPAPDVVMVYCNCGHTVPVASVLSASLGTSCPDCYDRLSD